MFVYAAGLEQATSESEVEREREKIMRLHRIKLFRLPPLYFKASSKNKWHTRTMNDEECIIDGVSKYYCYCLEYFTLASSSNYWLNIWHCVYACTFHLDSIKISPSVKLAGS